MSKQVQVGEIWPVGQWIYVLDGRWFQIRPGMSNGSESDPADRYRREEDEISEEDANARGIYRCVNS